MPVISGVTAAGESLKVRAQNTAFGPALLTTATVTGGASGGVGVVTEYYEALAAFPGASIGDTLRRIETVDTSTVPPAVLSTVWTNITTQAALPAAPLPANIAALSAAALTNAELRAAPVEVVAPPAVRTPALASSSTAGVILAGAVHVSFANTGTADAAVAGGTLPAGLGVTFDGQPGQLLGAIAFDATGTTLLISEAR